MSFRLCKNVYRAKASADLDDFDIHESKKSIKARDMSALADYRENERSRPHLIYLFLELTNACNLSCLHCGTPRLDKHSTMLKTSSALKAVESLSKDFPRGKTMLCLTGGEPLLHPDLLTIAHAAHKRGIPWGMTTNGTMIDRKMARELVSSGLRTVSVSLDGTAMQHDWLRRRQGSFDEAVKGIRALNDTSAYVQVTTVVHRGNINHLEELRHYVKGLGVASWRLVNVEPIGRALAHSELMLKPLEYRHLLDFIRRVRYEEADLDVCYGCSHYLSFMYEREVRDFYFQCEAGRSVASILCNGDIYGCLDIERRPELVQGNIEKDDLRTVWNERFQWFRSDRTLMCESCSNCDERRFCNGDSAHTWDFEMERPRLCYKDWWGQGAEHE